ncbi:MAG: sigma-54 dependent transcriptional regulator [Oceanospirillaceae bacterium]
MSATQQRVPSANPQPFAILIVDDEEGICHFLKRALCKVYTVVDYAYSTAQADKLREQQLYDLLIVDINMPSTSGIEWVTGLEDADKRPDIIFMTGFAELDNAVDAVRLGASDFILKPFRLEQITGAIDRSYNRLKLSRENYVLQHRLTINQQNHALLGESDAITTVNRLIAQVAPSNASILIEGETGTGKELAAAAFHELSGREGSFVPINCAAVSPELIESELFGHIKGAFTGATQARQGLFSYADGGTIFLDEISEMPLVLQGKLLRVLQESRIRPVGTEREKSINVRIIAASNKPLAKQVELGNFRADLFYRLNVLPIELPPLRKRLDDIELLVEHFNAKLSNQLNLPRITLKSADYQSMQDYHWPGNVRELRNLIERSILLGSSPKALLNPQEDNTPSGYPHHWRLEQVELEHIGKVLAHCGNNKTQAAQLLGITRKTVERKLSNNPKEQA